MPPAAISRSSTYFPKICGNIANLERSALPAALLGALIFGGCAPLEPVVIEVPVQANLLDSCPESDGGLTLSLTALGPFRAAPAQNVTLDASGSALGFPAETQGVEALLGNGYRGYTDRRTEAGIDVLLWPRQRVCELGDVASPGSNGYPGPEGGQALGYSPELGSVFVAGEDIDSGRSQNGLVFDANTGFVRVQPPESPLLGQRAYATVTPFDGGFLVAGGENPTTGEDSFERERWQNAYTYSPETGTTGDVIDLNWDRTRHAALPLPSGATLLVGGLGNDELVLQLEAVHEAVNQRPPQASTIGLPSLSVGRLDPVVLRLDDGRILVGGGSSLLGIGIRAVEWFSADATRKIAELNLSPLPDRVLSALPGGGALTVARCGSRDPADCERPLEAAWITGDDPPPAPTPVVIPDTTECVTGGNVLVPLLVPGSDGAPWLIATSAQQDGDVLSYVGTPACVFRFEAWPRSGDPAQSGPRFEGPFGTLDPPPDPRVSPLAIGPDHFAWVTTTGDGGLWGARFGARGPLSQDPKPLVDASACGADPTCFKPAHLAPDRPIPSDAAAPPLYDASGLALTTSDPPLAFWVTDTRYEDATVTITLAAGSTHAPELLFGAVVLGGEGCAWPPFDPAESMTLSAARRGSQTTLRAGPASVTCEVGPGALALGLRASASGDCSAQRPCESRLLALRVERD
jgi:hypothetical protein